MKNKFSLYFSVTILPLLLTGCGDYKTKREALGDLINDFFVYVGIDPLNGFGFLLLVVVVSELVDLKRFQEKTEFQKTITVGYWVITIGLVVLFILLKLNQPNT